MRKSIFLAAFLVIWSFTLLGQKFDLRVQAGANLTFMPDFHNQVAIINEGLIVPGIISPANSYAPLIASFSVSQTQPGLGFEAGVESRYNLGKGWKLSLSLGLDIMTYDFDTYINADGTPNLWLSEYTPEYGNTVIYYLNIKPVNVSKDFFKDRLTLQAGASLNINVYSHYGNTLVIYSDEANGVGKPDGIERVYFDSFGAASILLAGVHGRIECRIIDRLKGFISYEYFFNSVYQKDSSAGQVVQETKPSQLYFGLSYVILGSGK